MWNCENSLDNSNKYIWMKEFLSICKKLIHCMYTPQSCLHIVSRYFLRIFSGAILIIYIFACYVLLFILHVIVRNYI